VRRFLQVLILQSLVAIVLTATAAILLVAGLGTRKLRRLADISDRPIDNPPFLSVVIAARHEAEHLRATLTALLAQSYPALEVVVVNDRSTDATGSIADEMACADGRLQVVHVTSLPGGWLGKTHAMHAGAAQARGDYVLFTDGDVVFASGTLTRAMRLVSQDNVDHLAVVPSITSPSTVVRWSVGAFSIFFLLFTRAWQVADPRSRASIGIGAFNLVRTSVYREAGGHEPIRLRPDDDLRLGRLLKSRGAKAAVWRSAGLVQVDWYPSVRALIHGMEKNCFAALDYGVGAAIASFISQLLYAAAFLIPLWMTGPLRAVVLLDLTVMIAASAAAARVVRQPVWSALLQPLVLPFMAWVQARAILLTLHRGGIVWRDTFYPLSELRGNRPN
jgi:cellulose synthase/poly-beta-1,6-N-acetylglucosamine synthase-like glycosyltransferase